MGPLTQQAPSPQHLVEKSTNWATEEVGGFIHSFSHPSIITVFLSHPGSFSDGEEAIPGIWLEALGLWWQLGATVQPATKSQGAGRPTVAAVIDHHSTCQHRELGHLRVCGPSSS